MNPKIQTLKPIAYFIIVLFLSACSNLKVIEHSAPQKPAWIYGIEADYLIGEGSGNDYNEAKYNALQMIKEKVVASVAQSISFEQNIKINETRYKRAVEFLEEYTSKTVSKTGNRAYLKGISLSKVSEYYWEKHRVDRIEKVFYYIKYPFTQEDINKLIEEWKLQENELTERLDTLKLNKNGHTTVESIISEIEELQYLSGFFVDQRKASADISIKNLQSKLNAIQMVSITDSLGFYKYYLMLGEDSIKTQQKPIIESNCADIVEVKNNNQFGCIKYSYDNCSVKEENYITIDYNFEEWKLKQQINFDVSQKKISIENTNDIIFSSLNKKLFDKTHTIKCFITINSKSPVPFTIDRVELIPQLCKYNCTNNDNFKNYPIVIIDNINKSFMGKGNHSFEIIASVPKSKSKLWASRNGISTKISGKIYYSSKETNEHNIEEFTNCEYFTDW